MRCNTRNSFALIDFTVYYDRYIVSSAKNIAKISDTKLTAHTKSYEDKDIIYLLHRNLPYFLEDAPINCKEIEGY